MTTARHNSATEAIAVLTDPAFIPPPPSPGGPADGIRWLRSTVARFASGPAHRRRRALAVHQLAQFDADALQRSARAHTTAILAAAGGRPLDLMSHVARRVPVSVLAEQLGLPRLDVDAVRIAAAAYPLDTADPDADRAVARLVAAFGGVADEVTAARIGLLVQACDATAGLIGNAALALHRAPHTEHIAAIVDETVRRDPPVLATRRQVASSDAATTRDDIRRVALTGGPADANPPLAFGAGGHSCPGHVHAVAITIGVLEVLRGARLPDTSPSYEPSANLRIPARLEVIP